MSKNDTRRRTTFLIGTVAVALGVGFVGWINTGPTFEPGPDTAIEVPNPLDVFDPTETGDPLPRGYRQILERDRFLPVYQPTFAAPDELNWPEEMLVIGVTGGDEAKAYSVTFLNQREMVIDEIGGIPILVSW